MKAVRLTRLEEGPEGTFGVLKLDDEVFCWTLEPRDMLNAANISSIPGPQQYVCERFYSQRFKLQTFIIANVPERTKVLFHPLNIVEETEGCIGLGETIGKLRGMKAILNSGKTFKRFMKQMVGIERFRLTIDYHL